MISRPAGGNHHKLTPEDIYDAAVKGDVFAKNIWKRAGEHLGIALASLVNILNPDAVVLCGGVSRAGRFLLPSIKNTIIFFHTIPHYVNSILEFSKHCL